MLMLRNHQIKCYGCGALVDDVAGQPHKYIGAAQGCWNLYGEVLTKEYGEYGYPELTHRLTVDTYAVQHPGEPGRQSIQSVNIHLISLYVILIKNFNGAAATKTIGNILAKQPTFEWLEPPVPNGTKTIADVLRAIDKQEHEKFVREWADNVFGCWYAKHERAIELLATAPKARKSGER